MTTKYPRRKELVDGEERELQGTMRIACCDCGLVHDYEFYRHADNPDGPIYFTVHRNNKATAQTRRRRKIKITEYEP